MSGYRLSRSAQRDLIEIRSHIAKSDPLRAVDFVERLITRFEQLAARPFLGRSRDDLRPNLRSSLIDGYLVFYRVLSASADVEIVRIAHGRRDIVRLF